MRRYFRATLLVFYSQTSTPSRGYLERGRTQVLRDEWRHAVLESPQALLPADDGCQPAEDAHGEVPFVVRARIRARAVVRRRVGRMRFGVTPMVLAVAL